MNSKANDSLKENSFASIVIAMLIPEGLSFFQDWGKKKLQVCS